MLADLSPPLLRVAAAAVIALVIVAAVAFALVRRARAELPRLDDAPLAPPRAVSPGRPRSRPPALTQTMRAVGEGSDYSVRGFASLEALVALAVGLGLALACPWGHVGALVGAVASVFTLALFAYVLPRRAKVRRRGKRWLRLTMGLAPLAFALAACEPKYRLQPCDDPRASKCERDTPHRCEPGTPPVWVPAGDEPCSAGGQTCVVTEGVAHCQLALDGGAR